MNSPTRLKVLRELAAQNQGPRTTGEPRTTKTWLSILNTWRDTTQPPRAEINPEWEGYGARLRWIERPDLFARLVDTLGGWYIDEYGFDSVHGVVYQIPARNGEPIYLAGYADPHNDGPVALDCSTLWRDDDFGAKAEANRLAERVAEEYREEFAKAQAEQRIDAIADEISEARSACLALVRELRENKAAGIECGAEMRRIIRAEIARTREAQAELVAERERLVADYWVAVQC